MNATPLPTDEALKLLTDAHPTCFCGVDLSHTAGKYGNEFKFRAFVIKDDEVHSGDSHNPIEAATKALAEAATFDPDADLRDRAAAKGYALVPATTPA